MRRYQLSITILLLCSNMENIFAQLQYVPPIHAEIRSSNKLNGVLLLSTSDFHGKRKNKQAGAFDPMTRSLYPSGVQIVDPVNPWPPIFFANAEPGGDNYMGRGLYGDFSFQKATRHLYFYYITPPDSGLPSGNYFICDTNFLILDTFSGAHGGIDGHDLEINAKGERLYLANVDTILDKSAFSGNVADTAVLVTIQLIEITDKNDSLVFSWNPLEHMSLSDTYRNPRDISQAGNIGYYRGWDWGHGNSVGFTQDGNIAYSYRYLGVGKLNRKTGNIIWKLEGKSANITVAPEGKYRLQHDFHEISPNVFTVFSNGDSNNVCKAVTYKINERKLSAKIIRITKPVFSFYSLSGGNFEFENNILWIFNYGRYAALEGRQKCFEISDAIGTVQAVYSSPSENFTYQVQNISDWKPKQFDIHNESGVLSVDAVKTEVLWYQVFDTSATLVGHYPNFEPKTNGTYVAIIRKGFGWLVSKTYVF